MAGKHPGSLLAGAGDLTWETFASAVATGDAAVLDVIQEAGRALGIAVANLVGCYHIRQIVLSGRVTALGRPLLEAITAEVERRVLPAMAAATRLRYSGLDGESVLLGSAALVLQQELGIV
jgi:predicted NBD/HSP70 family sugar kinase